MLRTATSALLIASACVNAADLPALPQKGLGVVGLSTGDTGVAAGVANLNPTYDSTTGSFSAGTLVALSSKKATPTQADIAAGQLLSGNVKDKTFSGASASDRHIGLVSTGAGPAGFSDTVSKSVLNADGSNGVYALKHTESSGVEKDVVTNGNKHSDTKSASDSVLVGNTKDQKVALRQSTSSRTLDNKRVNLGPFQQDEAKDNTFKVDSIGVLDLKNLAVAGRDYSSTSDAYATHVTGAITSTIGSKTTSTKTSTSAVTSDKVLFADLKNLNGGVRDYHDEQTAGTETTTKERIAPGSTQSSFKTTTTSDSTEVTKDQKVATYDLGGNNRKVTLLSQQVQTLHKVDGATADSTSEQLVVGDVDMKTGDATVLKYENSEAPQANGELGVSGGKVVSTMPEEMPSKDSAMFQQSTFTAPQSLGSQVEKDANTQVDNGFGFVPSQVQKNPSSTIVLPIMNGAIAGLPAGTTLPSLP